MIKLKRQTDLMALKAADTAAMAAAFGAALVLSGQFEQAGDLAQFFALRIKVVNFIFFAVFALTWSVIFKMFGLYRPQSEALMTSEWIAIAKAAFTGTLVLSCCAMLMSLSAVNGVFLIGFFATALIVTVVERTLLRSFLSTRSRGRSLKNLVIVGCGARGAEFGQEIRRKPELGYLLLGYIDDIDPPENPQHGGCEKLLGSLSETQDVLEKHPVDEVMVNLPVKSKYDEITRIIAICEEQGLTVRVPTNLFKSKRSTAYIDSIENVPVVTFGARPCTAIGSCVKRAMDIIGSLVALLIFAPVAAVCALAIKLDSPGPVLFLQDRVGLRRQGFKVVKFRTMYIDAEARQKEIEAQNEVEGAAFKMKNDPRVTRTGRILRKLSLDELPQFWNVLAGDMSLVGPRPLPFRDVENFDQDWQFRRFSVKPGVTCLWQVNGRHEIDFDNWMELDLQYIDNWSLSLDMDILLKTLPAAVRGTGAS